MGALSVVVALVVRALVAAQPPPYVTSLDALVETSQTVAIGRIVAYTGGEGQFDKHEATFAVDKLLKGGKDGRLTSATWLNAEALRNLIASKKTLLLIIRGDPPTLDTYNLDDKRLRCLAEWQVLPSQKDVIPTIERIAREHPANEKVQTVKLGWATSDLCESWMEKTGLAMNLEVPVDARLEKFLRKELRSNKEMAVEQALQLIAKFGPEGNVPLVKPLLQSNLGVGNGSARMPGPGLEQREFIVRQLAYEALVHWGIQADRPARSAVVEVYDTDDEVIWQWDLRDDYLHRLTRYKNLKSLILFNAKGLTEPQLAFIGTLKSLRNLTINDTETVSDANLKDLAGLSRLENLDLGYTALSDAAVKTLAGFRKLKSLCVDKTGVTAKGVAEFARLRPDVKIVVRNAGSPGGLYLPGSARTKQR